MWITFQGWGKPWGNVVSDRGSPGDGLGTRAGVCVDWHRCARCVKDCAGEMWMGYPHVVRLKFGVAMRFFGVIPTFHSTTTSTDYLYLSMNVTCGRR